MGPGGWPYAKKTPPGRKADKLNARGFAFVDEPREGVYFSQGSWSVVILADSADVCRRLKCGSPYRARAPEDAQSRSNNFGIRFCQTTRSSAFFLCVATNDIAWATSNLVKARSGAPGTRARYRIGFSVAAPSANGSSISMSLPESQM